VWERIRYYLALFIVVSWPPALLFWFIIHPFVTFWRRVGPTITYAILLLVMTVIATRIFQVRNALLAVDYGTSYPLIAIGVILFAVTSAVFVRVRTQLTFPIIIGLPELELGQEQKLLTEGMFARMRNPRYVAIMLSGLSLALVANYLATYFVWVGFFIGLYGITLLEEKELRVRFGNAYEEYCRRVPRFVPKL
jgi:protein-S-isoprenylcysteine O-methyltransferase Ste14